MRGLILLLCEALAAACGPSGSAPTAHVVALREVGSVPDPPGASGRDVGFSLPFGGHSVWIFGDTFLASPAADGYQWRASTWSWTDDLDAADGLTGWHHALGADGAPLALVPHTSEEQAFDDAHRGSSCVAGNDCGARHTVWPATAVLDPARGALLFYSKEHTEPTGAFAFTGAGTSLAVWPTPDEPAARAPVVAGPNPDDPTQLFGVDEPPWGAAALVDGDTLYAYGCPGGGTSSPCLVARVPLAAALDRSAWRFFDGAQWVADWHQARPRLEGAPLMSVHFSAYLGQFVAFYAVPLTSTLALRVAPRPEGPWSSEERFGEGAPALDGTWSYGLAAHPELAADGGRLELLSYFQPGAFIDGTVHLLALTYR